MVVSYEGKAFKLDTEEDGKRMAAEIAAAGTVTEFSLGGGKTVSLDAMKASVNVHPLHTCLNSKLSGPLVSAGTVSRLYQQCNASPPNSATQVLPPKQCNASKLIRRRPHARHLDILREKKK